MRKIIAILFGITLTVSACGGGDDVRPQPAETQKAVAKPQTRGPRVLNVGDTADYEVQPGRYRLTLKSVQRTAEGVQVQWLSTGVAKAEMDLGKEYALTRDGERIDDIAIAGPDSLTDPDVSEHKTVNMLYGLPSGFTGSVVYVAYDGAKEYAAFSIVIK